MVVWSLMADHVGFGGCASIPRGHGAEGAGLLDSGGELVAPGFGRLRAAVFGGFGPPPESSGTALEKKCCFIYNGFKCEGLALPYFSRRADFEKSQNKAEKHSVSILLL